jgi:hypothetical protein
MKKRAARANRLFYFFLPPNVGIITGPPFELAAAAIVFTGTFFGFLVSLLPLLMTFSL